MTRVQILQTIRKALDNDERPHTEISKITGIHRVNLSQFKAGDRDLPLGSLVKLAKALGLEIDVRPAKSRVRK